MLQSFPKTQKLTHKKQIDKLFDKNNPENKAKTCYPFRVIFSFEEGLAEPVPKVLITVSKRNFKKAVDRNLLKRRTREAYRLNKIVLENKKIANLALIYIARDLENYEVIEKGVIKALKFISDVSKNDLNKF